MAAAAGGLQGLQHGAGWQRVALRYSPAGATEWLAGCCSDSVGRSGEDCGRGPPGAGQLEGRGKRLYWQLQQQGREDCSLGLPGAGQLIGGPRAGSWGAGAPGGTLGRGSDAWGSQLEQPAAAGNILQTAVVVAEDFQLHSSL